MDPIEMKQLGENLQKAAAEIRSELDGVKASVKDSAEFSAKFDKMLDQLTKTNDKIQVEFKAMQDQQKQHEALLARRDVDGSEQKASELVEKSKNALRSYLRKGANGFEGETGFKIDTDGGIEIRAMSTDSNADGGYLVIPEIANFMVKRQFETSPIRRVANVIRTQSKSLEVPIDDNESGFTWVGEGADSTSSTTTPQVGKLTIVAHKGAAQPAVTTEMLEDPFVNVDQWLGDKISDRFTRGQNTAFVQGTGVSQPRGFMTFSAWASAGVYERGKIEQRNLGSGTDVTADGLISLQSDLKEIYQGGAVWLMKRGTYGNVLKLKGTDNYFFTTSMLKDGQMSLQVLGKPVVFADDMAAVAGNALSVAYGDFSVGYTILDRVGLQILKDPYSSKGMVTFYATARVGGDVTNYESIKIGKIAA